MWCDVGVRATGSELAVLLAGARGGSPVAFERIYEELAPSVASYLRWNGAPDVDGLTNEVLANVHRGIGGFKGDWTAFRSWVFTIAHHRLVDEHRAARRRPVAVEEVSEAHAAVSHVEDDTLRVLGDESVAALLAVLSSDQRDVLLLRVVADLSLEEAAEALHKSIGAVKSLQHRALGALRRHLAVEEVGP